MHTEAMNHSFQPLLSIFQLFTVMSSCVQCLIFSTMFFSGTHFQICVLQSLFSLPAECCFIRHTWVLGVHVQWVFSAI